MALRNSFGATHGQAMSPLPSTMTPQSPSGDRQPSTPRSPFQELVNVAVIDNTNTTKQNPLSDNASVASSSRTDTSAAFKRFTCAFDPQQRNGSALMLRFDLEGNATFEEMSRIDILRMTQEAATPILNSEERGRVNAAARLVRATSFAGGVNLGASGAAAPPYGTIIDVQRVHARDIRKLDNAFSVSNEPSIELRNQAILMNADPVRAIIMRHCCLVFVPDGADSLLLMLQEMFRDAASQGPEVPYEFKALEALLGTLCRYFKTEYDKNAPVISTALDRLASGRMSASELELLRKFKNTMNEFESQVDGVRRALMEILDNEEDLRLLCLTKLHEDPSLLQDLWSFDSEEAEVLLENYLQDIFSTRTKASLMQHRIQNTESLVMLKLDSMRNYLLGVDLLFSILVVAISIGTFIAGIFGMNLNSGVQERAGWFWTVTGGSIGLIVLLTGAGWWFFRRQGVFMYKN